MNASLAALLYLAAGLLFILALSGLSSPDSTRRGFRYGAAGMAIAVVTTLVDRIPAGLSAWLLAVVGVAVGGVFGAALALRAGMTKTPQFLSFLQSLVGLAAVLVAAGGLFAPQAFGVGAPGAIHRASLVEISLAAATGAIAFAGAAIGALKLSGRMSGAPIRLLQRRALVVALAVALVALIALFAMSQSHALFFLIVVVALAAGLALAVSAGGADMPVLASTLSSCSGWATAGVGFTLGNLALIIAGALIGASAAVRAYATSKDMNRPLVPVAPGGAGRETGVAGGAQPPARETSAADAARILRDASRVVIAPGYGMAAAQAQEAVRAMADALAQKGVKVAYAIHPYAGRMPGHMELLLAGAAAPRGAGFESQDVDPDIGEGDVAFVVGANDVTNPAARTDPKSSIFGMPILDMERAKTIVFVKRGMGLGYAGVENALFHRDNALMLFGDARKVVESVVTALAR